MTTCFMQIMLLHVHNTIAVIFQFNNILKLVANSYICAPLGYSLDAKH
jgi:hypothetical protein